MSELDELVARHRFLMAGQFGSAVDTVTQSGFNQSSWLPVRSAEVWTI